MHNEIAAWLEHLHVLYPPTGVVLVGAGTGSGEWVQQLLKWEVANVTLIEADDAQYQHLQRSLELREDWRLYKQVIAHASETVTYHKASNATESGLIEPEMLRSLWPNLKTVEKQTREAITLADLLQDTPTPSNWLLVDCLPALPVVQGLGSLEYPDVIVARVLLDKDAPTEMGSLPSLQSKLVEQGYRLLITQAGRQPAMGNALFIRDTQATIHALRKQQAQIAPQRECDIEQHERQVKDLADQLQQIVQAKEAAEKLAAERQQQLETAAKSQAESLKTANDKAATTEKLATDRQAKIETLEKQVKQLQEADANLKQRQQALRDELTSAEAQIELIKDLLLKKDSA